MCKPAPSQIVLRNELNALFPGRNKGSDGACPSPEHTEKNPKSDHEPAKAGVAKGFSRARDFDERIGLPGPSPLMPAVGHLIRDPRTKYVIYEQLLYYPDGTTRRASGHTGHLHHSIHDWAVDDTHPWNIHLAFESEDIDMTPEQDARLTKVEKLLVDLEWWFAAEEGPNSKGELTKRVRDTHALVAAGSSTVTAQELADAISDEIAADVAALLSQRLAG